MNKSIMKSNPIMKIISSSMIYLPTPTNINSWWNMGSILGLCLMIQIISGLLLSIHYCPNTKMAFLSIIHIMQDVNYGWLIRFIHMNGASFFFICMYSHIARGLYYFSFKLIHTWSIGVTIFLLSMMTAFMGYVLPWGQMSYWGATVITNLISVFPLVTNSVMEWIWGSFSIDNATLNRFFSFHFILPFIILFMVIMHLMYLHQTGSSNPLGLNSNLSKTSFHPYFIIKDLVGFMLFLFIFMFITLQSPNMFSDPDNFIECNPLSTPHHIKPEWYFLFAYAILRSIPSKLGGVIALFSSILILLMPIFFKIKSNMTFNPFNQILYWLFIYSFILLTWTGGKNIEYPFTLINLMSSLYYFSYLMSFPMINNYWFKTILN